MPKKSFSGTIHDRLGRKRCYRNGFPIACGQRGGDGGGKAPPEAPSQGTSGEPQGDGDPAGGVREGASEEAAPVEINWQEAAAANVAGIEGNNLSNYPYSEEELAAEKAWHEEFIEWTASNPPTEVDIASIARFVTGLLNPLMGGVPYIDALAQQYGIGMGETSFVYTLFHNFKWMLDDIEVGEAVSKLAGNLLGDAAASVVQEIPQEERPAPVEEEPEEPLHSLGGLRGLRRTGGRFSNLSHQQMGERLGQSHEIRRERKLRFSIEIDPETEECECEVEDKGRGIPEKYGRQTKSEFESGYDGKSMSAYNVMSGGALVGMPYKFKKPKNTRLKRSVLSSL